MSSTALILAGHGSHISPETAGIVWRQVDRLRALGVADEVTAAFWKEMPSYHTVLRSLNAEDITVIPLFTARGYFTGTVIPAEMGLTGVLTPQAGKMVRYTPALGEHPSLGDIVQRRVDEGLQQLNVPPEHVAIVIIGHSTRRNPQSRLATEAQAQKVRERNHVAQVEAVYLDDDPDIASIYQMTSAPYLLAIPYFLALGSHTTIDVPAALGLENGETSGEIQGRHVLYTPPIGEDETLTPLILDLARETGARLMNAPLEDVWQGFPQAGRAQFLSALERAGELHFGQLRVTTTSVQVWDDPNSAERLTTPAALRRRVRENPFRPLATSADLPRGWHVEIENMEAVHAAVETIYPGAVGEWAAGQAGTLAISTLDETAARQTGMYRQMAGLSREAQARTVQTVCGTCVKQPVWFEGDASIDSIPCPEPCNVWLSAALEAQA